MSASRRQALRWAAGLGVTMIGGKVLAADGLAGPDDSSDVRFHPASVFTQGGWARGKVSSRVARLGFMAAANSVTMPAQPVPLSPDGEFMIAFDRDSGPAALLVATFRPGRGDGSATTVLRIAPRQWNIETVNAPFHPPGLPDAEFARIRAGELAQIAAARAVANETTGWLQDFHWPAKARISGLFGAQRVFRDPDGTLHPAAYHPGLDIALATGTAYAAPADGVVILAAADRPFTLEGHLLMVDHGMGLNSAFLHSSALLVKVGDRVVQGQPIGAAGMTGRATGPHLHWALKWRDARLDPLLFVGPMG